MSTIRNCLILKQILYFLPSNGLLCHSILSPLQTTLSDLTLLSAKASPTITTTCCWVLVREVYYEHRQCSSPYSYQTVVFLFIKLSSFPNKFYCVHEALGKPVKETRCFHFLCIKWKNSSNPGYVSFLYPTKYIHNREQKPPEAYIPKDWEKDWKSDSLSDLDMV